MIKIKNIYKSFGDNNVLKDITINIKKGESLCIIGKSGVGKSIILKQLIGLMKPDRGEVHIDGKIINQLRIEELQKIRSIMGMVFQFGALFDYMNIIDNISMPLKRLTKLSNQKIINRSLELLNEVGLKGIENLMPSDISGGMKKRVGIARAIATKPKYLLYDEPTTGLDPVMTDSINKLIAKIHKEEKLTSIIVTHEMRTVYSVASRVLLLDDGRIKFDGTPEQIKKSRDKTILQFIKGDSSL